MSLVGTAAKHTICYTIDAPFNKSIPSCQPLVASLPEGHPLDKSPARNMTIKQTNLCQDTPAPSVLRPSLADFNRENPRASKGPNDSIFYSRIWRQIYREFPRDAVSYTSLDCVSWTVAILGEMSGETRFSRLFYFFLCLFNLQSSSACQRSNNEPAHLKT